MPVRARPDTVGYRTRKFASRHAVSVTGLAIAFVALVVGVIVFGYLYRDAANARAAEQMARENAESRAAEAEQTASFFANMLESVSPGFAKGRDMTIIREVLDGASDEVTTELAEFPQAQATLRLTVGNTYRLLGDYERAAPHLDAALALNTRLHGQESPQAADVLHRQALLSEAIGEYDDARDLYARELPIRERESDRVGTAEIWGGQARMAYYAGNVPEMLLKAEQARDVFLDEIGELDERTLEVLGLVAAAHTLLGRYDEAEAGQLRIIELWNQLEGPMHPNSIASEANLAMLLRQLRRNEEAEVRLSAVVDRAATVFGEDHESTLAARTSLAQTLQALQRYDEAEGQVRIAIETLRKSLGEKHPDTLHAMSVLGSVLRGAERFDEAIAVLRKSHELHVEVMGVDAPGTNSTAAVLGAVLIEAGEQHWPEAEALLTDALERLVKLAGPEFQLTRTALKELRRLYAPDVMDRPDKLAKLDERFGEE